MALSGAGWNGSAGLSGTKTPDPQSHLTITDCVGCHTSMTADTIVTWKDSKIPIVYNKQVPTNPLAGGNFYWVEAAGFGDEYGHNVWGISDPDTLINQAPGNTHTCSNKGCHISLAKNPVESGDMFEYKNGCEGCHYYYSHHDSGTPSTQSSAYRFLEGHDSNTYVMGLEDADWERADLVSSTKHNEYQGNANDHSFVGDGYSSLANTHAMSSYCKGCHTIFHQQTQSATNNAWVRHPSDVTLPNKGEYASYTVYNPIAPVARQTLPSSPSSAVTPGTTDIVMCLSCHRPHGSPYKDILRWDYSTMLAGGSGATGNGCFVCHTQKDD
ncbi:MAG: cytochrome c3 family protein [Pseudomonadota bacterium]